MYNQDRKERFIVDSGNSRVYMESIFNRTAAYEERAGLDFAELSGDALRECVNKVSGIRRESWNKVISSLRSYNRWCKANGYPACDEVLTLVYSAQEDRIRKSMVASPLHLSIIMDRFFDPSSEQTPDCILRCFWWLAFSGLTAEEASLLRTKEVDLKNLRIEHDGNSYDIYREAVRDFSVVYSATEFKYVHDNPYYVAMKQRADGDCILRSTRSNVVPEMTLRNMIRRKLGDDFRLSYENIRRSGLYYKLYELERAGVPAEPVIQAFAVNETTRRADGQMPKQTDTIANAMRRVRKEYELWKRIFT